MSDLLELANAANEAAIAYRHARESMLPPGGHLAVRADSLAESVDRLTGAVVEAANDAPIVLRREDLPRIAEVEDVAFGLGKTVPEAIVWLVNERLSGSFHDGYNAAIHDAPAATALPERRLVEIRALGQGHVGRFVDPAMICQVSRVLDRRGEAWAAAILGRDISARSAGAPHRPALRAGEEYALVFADAAEDRHALGLEQ